MFFYCEPLFLTKGKKTEEGLAAGTGQHPQRQQRQACRSAPSCREAPRASPPGGLLVHFHSDWDQETHWPTAWPKSSTGAGLWAQSRTRWRRRREQWPGCGEFQVCVGSGLCHPGVCAYVVITPKGPTVHHWEETSRHTGCLACQKELFAGLTWEAPRLDVTRSLQQASKLASDVIKQARSRQPQTLIPILQPDRGQLSPALSTHPAPDCVGWGSCWWIGSAVPLLSVKCCPGAHEGLH